MNRIWPTVLAFGAGMVTLNVLQRRNRTQGVMRRMQRGIQRMF